ncbi:ATP-binding cassette domain-containing protein [Proteinivorax hydrogeniformans]|uniref:ATP-binding cassette domain-containing protein n=1 Tax=Proteinivorax hydrogeniformans TaxID=1826727 RepID=A0AAU8HWW8_9FIRM
MKQETIISANDIGVKYDSRFKRDDIKSLSHDLLLGKTDKKSFWALKDISFEAYKGEILGVIGSNGAGKSTLCKVIAKILHPDSGEIEVKGKVSALLSMGAGFNRELSGRDNVYLNGMMMGMSRTQVKEYFDEIHKFSGLGDFIDESIKNYSSGMRARLGFSIAAMLNPETLVLDEALNTGDLEFSKRATKKINELVIRAKMVIIVSHNIKFIRRNCTRAIWINSGSIEAEGDPKDVAAKYRAAVPKRMKKKKVVNLKQTESDVKEKEVVIAKNLGIKFKMQGEDFWPLKNISFSVSEGDIIGIIGHNGAGKSTLCRTLSGIYRPDEGEVHTEGATTALLSIGSGFNRHLSGMDNIILVGMLMGISKKKIHELKDEIIEFANLEKHIHKPVKNYSSGMRSRLGFSIASAIQPELFIIDEALSAGDMEFRAKASERMQEMITDAKAVIVVTHNMKFVEKVCTRSIWINKGELVFDGDPKEAVNQYRKQVTKKEKR